MMLKSVVLKAVMLKSVVGPVAFSALVLAALAGSAQASWLFDDNAAQSAGRQKHSGWQNSGSDTSPRHASRQAASAFGAEQGVRETPTQGQIPSSYEGMVAQHAGANGVPTSLVHRVIMRESRYNPRAVSMGNYGLMQIRLGTARAMGYTGSAAGLLDAETNMTYAVKYLAGAYRAAHGNEALAVALYARGYYARGGQSAGD
jgi:soluble lytic murein transglycosylase-like protein